MLRGSRAAPAWRVDCRACSACMKWPWRATIRWRSSIVGRRQERRIERNRQARAVGGRLAIDHGRTSRRPNRRPRNWSRHASCSAIQCSTASQPRPSIGIGQWNARGHLCDVFRRVECVAIRVRPAQPRGQLLTDGGFSTARNAHHDQCSRGPCANAYHASAIGARPWIKTTRHAGRSPLSARLHACGQSNSPLRTPATNAAHSSALKMSTDPSTSLELRIAIMPSM